MKEHWTPIASVDVALVDPDLLWRVERMNLLHGALAREFAHTGDALAAMTPGHRVVLVLGPHTDARDLDDAVAARGERPELRIAVCPTEADAAEVERRRRAGADEVIPADAGNNTFVRIVHHLFIAGRETPAPNSPANVSAAAVPASVPNPGPRPLGRTAPSMPSRLVVLTSAKGGEGTSTVALNLACSAAEVVGSRTAIVDGDPFFGDITMDFGAAVRASPIVRELPIPDEVAEQLISRPEEDGPLVIRSPHVGPELAARGPDVLRDVLRLAAERADVVIADVPIELLLASNVAADASIVALVSTRRTTSLKNTTIAAQRLGLSRKVGLIINETDRRHRVTFVEELASEIGLPLLGHLPYDAGLHRTASHARPHGVADGRTRYARQMVALRRAVGSHFPAMV